MESSRRIHLSMGKAISGNSRNDAISGDLVHSSGFKRTRARRGHDLPIIFFCRIFFLTLVSEPADCYT